MAYLLPNVRPMPGDVLLLVIPHYWGKGETVRECIENIEGSVKDQWYLFSVHPKTTVDGMGALNWYEKSEDHPDGHEPIKLCDWEDGFIDPDAVQAALSFTRWDQPTPNCPPGKTQGFLRGWEAFFSGKAAVQHVVTGADKEKLKGWQAAADFYEEGA